MVVRPVLAHHSRRTPWLKSTFLVKEHSGVCEQVSVEFILMASRAHLINRATLMRLRFVICAPPPISVVFSTKGLTLEDVDEHLLEAFDRHLLRCQCPWYNRGKTGYHARFGVKLFPVFNPARGLSEYSDRRCDQQSAGIGYRIWRLASYTSWRYPRDSPVLHPRRDRTVPYPWGRCQPVECPGGPCVSVGSREPVWN
jgi:hypothetical protein